MTIRYNVYVQIFILGHFLEHFFAKHVSEQRWVRFTGNLLVGNGNGISIMRIRISCVKEYSLSIGTLSSSTPSFVYCLLTRLQDCSLCHSRTLELRHCCDATLVARSNRTYNVVNERLLRERCTFSSLETTPLATSSHTCTKRIHNSVTDGRTCSWKFA